MKLELQVNLAKYGACLASGLFWGVPHLDLPRIQNWTRVRPVKSSWKTCTSLSQRAIVSIFCEIRSMCIHMEVSLNRGTPRSSICMILHGVFPNKNHPFLGYPHDYGNPHIHYTKYGSVASPPQQVASMQRLSI